MDFVRRYIVQDRETGQFVCPRLGDVGLCVLFQDAGRFETADEAREAGVYLLDADALVIPIWERDLFGEAK
ncbi:hypothetical protein GPA22_17685 [Aromatoleum toluvorans]|uniref:YCII-related domain-containing protein n=1 Tax=Aromatoleum toluvorans TaxID=92002 RepID=A0ABX1Q4U0_9RHOO|nr:hypothetical protein [Aromatoleum toluvorans]NMG45549.1 hypothetical protein [Aromatoleum toluvorans]